MRVRFPLVSQPKEIGAYRLPMKGFSLVNMIIMMYEHHIPLLCTCMYEYYIKATPLKEWLRIFRLTYRVSEALRSARPCETGSDQPVSQSRPVSSRSTAYSACLCMDVYRDHDENVRMRMCTSMYASRCVSRLQRSSAASPLAGEPRSSRRVTRP